MNDRPHRPDEINPESTDKYELRGDTELSIAVIEAVAETAGCDPLELDPLGAYVNPDALDTLFSGSQHESARSVSFPFGDHHVTVQGDGTILVHAG